MEVSGQLHAPAALPQYCQSGRRDEEKKFSSLRLPQLNPGRPARSLVTILTELPRLTQTKANIF